MDTPARTGKDGRGRYLVLPPDATTPTGYTRATTVAGMLSDKSGINKWDKAMVALGLALRPDLLSQVHTVDFEDPTQKPILYGICDRAHKAGGGDKASDLGTAWHAIAHQAAEEPDWMPPAPYDRDIAALRETLRVAGLEIVGRMNERMMVNDDWQIAGTADLILTDGTDLFYADYKTGREVKYSGLDYSIQLAIYANCQNLYTQHPTDPLLDVREPMPPVSKSTGIIIHIRPGSGHCDLYWLDLEIGLEALELAMEVRVMRKQKPLVKIAPTAQVKAEKIVQRIEAGQITDTAREALVQRAKTLVEAGHTDAILEAWPADIPTPKTGHPYTIEQAERIGAALALIEKFFGEPFPPAEPTDTKRPEPKPAPRHINEGEPLVETEIEPIKQATLALEPESKEWLAEQVKAASRAKKNIRLTGPGGKMTERRAIIANALCEAAVQRDDLLFRGLLEQIVEAPVFAEDVGRIVGNLTILDARRLHVLAHQVNTGLLTPTWYEDHVEFTELNPNNKGNTND
jgi:PD-(D/E)XK nuclease superfamily